jgi:hypothetical protein
MTRFTLALLSMTAACSGATTNADGPDKTTTGGDVVCGDAIAQGDEPCDGPDLTGLGCADVPGFTGGVLACRADCSGLDVSACTADPLAAVVRINEVTSTEILEGAYAGAGDAVELYNAGMAPADLSGLQLSDDAGFAADKTYAFPAGLVLDPGAFVVVTKLDDVTGEGDYTFGISDSNPETIYLGDANGSVLDEVAFSGADAVVSWCRLPDGADAWQACARTFGAPNQPDDGTADTSGDPVCGDGMRDGDEDCDGDDVGDASCPELGEFSGGRVSCADDCTWDTSACTPVVTRTPIAINELESSGDDAIELYNASGRAVPLGGWILTDDLASPGDAYDPDADLERLEFEPGATIGAGEFLVILAGDPPMHPFGLGAGGDRVALIDAEGVVVDFVEYGADEAAMSYCRVPDGPFGAWEADCTPTFGEPNAQ